MADLMVEPEPAVAAEPVAVGRPGSVLRSVMPALILVGAAIVYVGLVTMNDLNAGIRLVVVIVGVSALYFGVDAVARRLFGPRFETDLWLSVGWVGSVVLLAIFADLLPLSESLDPSKTLAEPSRVRPDLFSVHPLGTDTQALDMLGGVIYGARVSLQVSVTAVAVGTIIGGIIGVASGYFGGKLDSVVGVATDSLLAFPPLILLLAVVTAFAPGVITISLALALLGIPTYLRLARANSLAYKQREFVLAARAMGAKPSRIILRELVPNVVRPVLSFSFIIVAVLIVAEASLSFLGVGIQRPTPTWGNMISAGQGEIETSPHLVFVPGTVMFLTVFCLNRIGDKARAVWDPKQSAL